MELDEFVKATLVQIVDGVVNAQEIINSKDATINPKVTGYVKNNYSNSGNPPQEVNFDVALTDSSSKGTAGGIGVFLGAVTLGSKGKGSSEKSSLTRIQFSIPLLLPTGKKN